MFIQIIHGTVGDADRFHAQADRWATDLKPGAPGYLGCTWGLAPNGIGFLAARFESEGAATANSARPEQGEWWADMAPAFGSVTFHDCHEVDTMFGGGSDRAGFVQVIQGQAKNQEAARAMIAESQRDLAISRPDILGGVMAWHGDRGHFTQIMYFRSEASARAGETSESDDDVNNQYRNMMAGPPAFINLTSPRFD